VRTSPTPNPNPTPPAGRPRSLACACPGAADRPGAAGAGDAALRQPALCRLSGAARPPRPPPLAAPWVKAPSHPLTRTGCFVRSSLSASRTWRRRWAGSTQPSARWRAPPPRHPSLSLRPRCSAHAAWLVTTQVTSGLELLDEITKRAEVFKSPTALSFPRDDKKLPNVWSAWDLPVTRQGVDRVTIN